MKTYKEKHVYVDDSSLEDEDWMTLRKIMRQISCCEVDEGELEGIRREIIGMAKEARVRGRSLREEIGESERTFSEEIFRASTGREMAPGRKQLKGVGIFFIVYGIVYLVHWGIRFLFFGMLNLMESYQGGGLDNFEQMYVIWGIKEIIVEISILLIGIWTVRHCGDRRRRKKQKIAGICLFVYFGAILTEILIGYAAWSATVWIALDAIAYGVFLVPLIGIIASGIYLSAVGRNKKDWDED